MYTPEVEPLAIVGLAFRFPGDADSSERFWRMLEERRCAATEMPADRMNIVSFYHSDNSRVDNLSMRGAHFMDGELGAFDAPFFSISPAEAAAMDPQQRIMLETAYHALENAGLPLKSVAGSRTSVFTGSFSDDHKMLSLKDPELLSPYAGSATSFSILANRISWWFDLKGPSMNIDSACSSSLLGLHLACQSLRSGETTMSLVGGSNVLASVEQFLLMTNLNMLGPSGRSFGFDHRANGYSRGEGFGMVVVKRLSDAISNGDTIRAVIRATGTNQDGRTPSLTAPSQAAQEALIRETYQRAGLDLKRTAFVEAHGTGTPLGDPIEARALGSVFGAEREAGNPVYIGALKSNIGHLEGGSGIAGLIKAVLVLERGIIPPNANFEKVNPAIDAEGLNITFPTECTPWPSSGLRRASVNSFGFGGSNSHVVLDDACNYLKAYDLQGKHQTEEAYARPDSGLGTPIELSLPSTPSFGAIRDINASDMHLSPATSQRPLPKLLTWSGADEKASLRLTEALAEYFSNAGLDGAGRSVLRNLAYTLAARRSHLSSRRFAVLDSAADLPALAKMASRPVREQRSRRLCFVFTGQGAQYAQMGLQLLGYPTFRGSVERADLYLRKLGCEWSVLEELAKSEDSTHINEPERSQPLCTVLQVALVDLLASFGLKPQVVVGHSSGEIAAAYANGSLSAASAWKVAYLRGKVAARLTSLPIRGSMMAAGLPESQALVYINRYRAANPMSRVVVACNNSPSSVTLAGDEAAIDALKTQLDGDGVFVRKLRVSVAYHSPHVHAVSDAYCTLLEALEPGDANSCSEMVSSVTGSLLTRHEATNPSYWVSNMESTVRFSEAMSEIIALQTDGKFSGQDTSGALEQLDFVEIGPHGALKGPVGDIVKISGQAKLFRYDTVMDRKVDAAYSLLSAVGRLHCLGYSVDLMAANALPDVTCASLKILTDVPAYPFERSTIYWHKSRSHQSLAQRKVPRLDLLGTPLFIDGPPQMSRRWRKFTKASETPWALDHVVNGSTIYPAAGMVCVAIEAAKQVSRTGTGIRGFRLTDVEFLRPLPVPEEGEDGVESQLELLTLPSTKKDVDSSRFVLCSVQDGSWVENCHGNIHVEYGAEQEWALPYRAPCTRSISSSALYEFFEGMGLSFGESFRSLSDITIGSNNDACATMEAYPYTADESHESQPHVIHPITLDGIFQTVLTALVRGGTKRQPTAVPTKLHELYLDGSRVAAPATASIKTYAKVEQHTMRTTTSSAQAMDDSGRVLVSVTELQTTFVDTGPSAVEEVKSDEALCYRFDWQPDVEFLAYDTMPEELISPSSGGSGDSHFKDLSLLFGSICADTLKEISTNNLAPGKPYLQNYVRWMDSCAASYATSSLASLPADSCADALAQLSDKVAHSSVEGEGVVKMAQHLKRVLLGQKDPLEIIFHSNWAEQYYQEANRRTQRVLQHVIELIAFKNPGLKVLEIGAGTGSTTELVLEYANSKDWQIDGKDASAVDRYDFTDISPAFFGAARDKFKTHGERMNFTVLDVSKDPTAQGFQEASYDLIVAANVLHATPDLNITLSNTRKLLKPGGKLVLLEITQNQWAPQIMFGTLPGWWLSADEYREPGSGPCISDERWSNVLTSTGFSGTDLVLHDSNDAQTRVCSVMVATAVEGTTGPTLGVSIVVRDEDVSSSLVATLQTELQLREDCDIGVLSLTDAVTHDLSTRFVVSLLESSKPFLASMSEPEFLALRTLLSRNEGLLWVRNTEESSPEFQMSDGLLRVLRSENINSRYMSYASSSATPETVLAKNIVRMVRGAPDAEAELEYREINGNVCISRAVPAIEVVAHIQNPDVAQQSTSRAIAQFTAANSSQSPVCDLDSDATYVIVGGFGGLARNICRWMVKRGARNLLLLSRSGPSSKVAKELLADLAAQGVRVEAPACDVSNAARLNDVVSRCATILPSIKGCIQGALVLQDSIFDSMTYQQWTAAIAPRVQGTQNLHAALPSTLDFFILLSSINGILGNPSQSNYAASSTYLDAFAATHSTTSAPIISLDLGWMGFAGTVAESEDITRRLETLKYLKPVSETEMLGLLDYYCDGARAQEAVSRQVVIGVSSRGSGNTVDLADTMLDRPQWKHLRFQDSMTGRGNASGAEGRGSGGTASATEQQEKISSLLAAAPSLADAAGIVLSTLLRKLAADLGVEQEGFDESRPMHETGVDSLMAVQIRSWLKKEMGANVSVFDLMGNKSLRELGTTIAAKSTFSSHLA